MRSPCTHHRGGLFAAAQFTITSAAGAADKGVLGDDLADLTKSVDRLGSTKGAVVDGGKPATNPADVKPPIAAGTRPAVGSRGVLGDDLGDLEKSVARLGKPGGEVKPPVTGNAGGAQPPIVGADAAVRTIDAKDWTFKANKGVTIADGSMTLAAAGAQGSAAATFRQPLTGDFELRIAFTLPSEPVGKKAELSRGLGIRLESAAGWKGERMLSLDRTADKDGDLLLAAHSDANKEPLMARPKGSSCEIRIQRKANQFRAAFRNENAREWTEMGSLEAEMSPSVLLWITTYVTLGEARGVVQRVDLMPAAR